MAQATDIETRLDAILVELRSLRVLIAELVEELREPPAPIPLDRRRRLR